MFDRILGLPMHPLVVHGVVVLLPLMGVVTVLSAFRPAVRPRWAWAVVAANAFVLVLAVVAKESGEALLHRMAGLQIERHEELGGLLPATALLLTASAALLAMTGRRPGLRPWATALTVAAAGLAIVWTVLTGHSGAEAVWGSR
ncbi:MAG: DUF2231 domain-containing protein [Dermatophilaceae bacterium]